MARGITDVFIPPASIGNAEVMRGRNENSGMTMGGERGEAALGNDRGGATARGAKRRFAGRIPKRRLGTTREGRQGAALGNDKGGTTGGTTGRRLGTTGETDIISLPISENLNPHRFLKH